MQKGSLMQIYNDIFPLDTPCCVALGFFDGVHIGHRRLLSALNSYSEKNGLSSCVFTFAQSPCAALGKTASRSLQTYEARLSSIEEFSGADFCFAVDFLKYKDVPAEKFVREVLLKKLGVRAAFCGFNFRFGKKAEGDTAVLGNILAQNGAALFVTEPVCTEGETVSSSRIRNMIADGNIFSANAMLAHPFSVEGTVSHGKQNGRKVGIPTVNQTLPDGFVVPRFGVYASFAHIGGKTYRSITNIGVRPTVSGEGVNCETHILEPVGEDLYGREVRTELLWFERDERKFDDLDALAEQIRRDIKSINSRNIYDLYISGAYRNGCQ